MQAPDSSPALRYEIKMAAQASAYPWVKAQMRLDPAGVRVLYPPRRVQSVYFDTLDQSALHENLAGISHREKLRFRWYGDEVTGVVGNLERKVRENQLGWKDVVPIPTPVDVEGALRRDLERAVFSGLQEGWMAEKDRSLTAVQWISYKREYFTTADGRVRITIDLDVQSFDQRGRRVITRAFPTPLPKLMIIEAKCDAAAYAEARRLLNGFPLHIDRCSKFVLASRPDEGPPISVIPLAGT